MKVLEKRKYKRRKSLGRKKFTSRKSLGLKINKKKIKIGRREF